MPSRSATRKVTAPIRVSAASRSVLIGNSVLIGTPFTVIGSSCFGCSADDGETAGPADLVADREGQLQEADGLQLAGPLEGAGVYRLQTGRLDQPDELLLGGVVV